MGHELDVIMIEERNVQSKKRKTAKVMLEIEHDKTVADEFLDTCTAKDSIRRVACRARIQCEHELRWEIMDAPARAQFHPQDWRKQHAPRKGADVPFEQAAVTDKIKFTPCKPG